MYWQAYMAMLEAGYLEEETGRSIHVILIGMIQIELKK
jgi:hypothetical protein